VWLAAAETRHNGRMPTSSDVVVRPLDFTRREINNTAAVAARAFQTDPFFAYLSPDALQRARGVGLYMAGHLASLKGSTVTTVAEIDGEIVGVCAWVPPGGFPLSVRAQVIDTWGAARALYRRPRAVPAAVRFLLAVEHVHPKDRPHWYLSMLATDPSVQRSGIGSRLIADVLERCDTEGLPAYLETQKEANLVYYRRHRFGLTEKLSPVRGGPSLWTMTREPANP